MVFRGWCADLGGRFSGASRPRMSTFQPLLDAAQFLFGSPLVVYPLVNVNKKQWKMAIEIVSFPIKNGDFSF